MDNSTSCLAELGWDFLEHSLQVNTGKRNEVFCNLRFLGWTRHHVLPDLRVFFRTVTVFMINWSCGKQSTQSLYLWCYSTYNLYITVAWCFLYYTVFYSFPQKSSWISGILQCNWENSNIVLFSEIQAFVLSGWNYSAKWSSISANLPSTWEIQNCLSCPQLPQPRYCSFKYILIQNFDMLHCIKKYPYLSKYKVIEPHADHHKVSQFLSPLWHFHTSDSA